MRGDNMLWNLPRELKTKRISTAWPSLLLCLYTYRVYSSREENVLFTLPLSPLSIALSKVSSLLIKFSSKSALCKRTGVPTRIPSFHVDHEAPIETYAIGRPTCKGETKEEVLVLGDYLSPIPHAKTSYNVNVRG